MIKSILLTSLRNLIRNRSFSFINLIGLSISMSLSLLIIIMVREQFTFDNFHQDADRIFRINTRAIRKSGGTEPYASSPVPLGAALAQDYSFTDKVVLISSNLGGDVAYGNTVVPYTGYFVDPTFFEVFNFKLEKGNPKEALANPNGVVIVHDAVRKIFGEADPMGKTLTLHGFGEFVVTGVVAPSLGKSHIEFEILASTSKLPILEKEGVISPLTSNWNNYYTGYNYIKLQPGVDPEDLNNALEEISTLQYSKLSLETRDKGYEFYLQPLSEITPGPILSNQLGKGVPELLLIFLGVLAGIVMVMACFNYTNLMIAKSLTRTREIGVRKVNGATRFHVFLQFIGESVIFAMLALGISYFIMQGMKPGVMQLHIADEFAIGLVEDNLIYLLFLLFALLVGLLAGLLPALYLSSIKPLRVLKGSGDIKVSPRITFRKILIAAQFTFSVIFVITVIVINQQIKYVLNADYGMNQENLLNVRLQGNDYQQLDNAVSGLAGVNRVGGVSHSLGTWADGSDDYKRSNKDESFVMRDFSVNTNYIENLQLEFVAGKNFDEGDRSFRHVILNESALVSLGFEDARSAVGQAIIASDTIELLVIGVLKDFHFRPLNYQIGPLAFRYNPESISIASISYTGNVEALEEKIKSIWATIDPVHPIQMMTMTDEIDKAYSDSGFTDVLTILGYIAFLAVSLACLGMLGMAMFTTQTRIKEIGLRKALGASMSNVVLMLSRSFLILIGIGIVIGTPIAYFLGDSIISNYAYRITVTPWMLLSGIVLLSVLGIITISSQTIIAARRSPIKSLRYE